MPLYDSVNGVARKVVKMYDGVGGVAREVTKAYTKSNGVVRPYFHNSFRISELPVGTSVFANVGGKRTEFIIVQQGKPDSNYYNDSCDGTWLLSKYVYDDFISIASYEFYSQKNSKISYGNLALDYNLNESSNSFLQNLDPDIQNLIKTVRIPYITFDFHYWQYPDGELAPSVGSNVSSIYATKIFLLSGDEIGSSSARFPRLSYFQNCTTAELKERRVGYRVHSDGEIVDGYYWAVRDCEPSFLNGHTVDDEENLFRYIDCWISLTGFLYNLPKLNGGTWVRPAFILPFNARVDDNFNIITE